MCLIVLAFKTDSRFPLIVAGNRDEFHARPTHDAGWWSDQQDVLGGRDLQAGGTWLALHRAGRFAAVTNYRDAQPTRRGKRSRGHLVTEFLNSEQSPIDYVNSIEGDDYSGVNLLVSDGQSLACFSNRDGIARELPAGIYGLSNATLDTPWEKVSRSKEALQKLLDENAVNETSLMRLLADRDKGPVSEVRSDRLPFASAHAITAPFIVLPEYGTRCSTVVLGDQDGKWSLLERRFDAVGNKSGESRFSFDTVDRQ
ncbi:MAG: NRDE family protein [Woeseiaceae bacterium]